MVPNIMFKTLYRTHNSLQLRICATMRSDQIWYRKPQRVKKINCYKIFFPEYMHDNIIKPSTEQASLLSAWGN